MSGRAYIGTSGWNYPEWRDDFYRDVPRKDWLRHYARCFASVEVNATFYRLQEKSTFTRWHDETPAGFRFAIKANRFLTHRKKLHAPTEPIRLDRDRATALADKLAVVVWQLPHGFGKNLRQLDRFAEALRGWPEARHTIEFRDESWFDHDVADCLRAHDVAACQSDAASWPLWDVVTTDFVYVRLHGHEQTYCSPYTHRQLSDWAHKITRWWRDGHDVYVYFDNTAFGHAPLNAMALSRMLDETSAPARPRVRQAPQRSPEHRHAGSER